jgi:hypothetical protein
MHLIPSAHGYYAYDMPDQEVRRIIQQAPKWDGEEGAERNLATLLCDSVAMNQKPKLPGPQVDYFCDHALEVAVTARAYQLDPWIFTALGTIESSWKPAVVSPKKACGLYQVMPGPGRPSCKRMQENPTLAIQMGGKILRDWIDGCHGNLECGLRSYNGGNNGPKMIDTIGFYHSVTGLARRYKSVLDVPKLLPTT